MADELILYMYMGWNCALEMCPCKWDRGVAPAKHLVLDCLPAPTGLVRVELRLKGVGWNTLFILLLVPVASLCVRTRRLKAITHTADKSWPHHHPWDCCSTEAPVLYVSRTPLIQLHGIQVWGDGETPQAPSTSITTQMLHHKGGFGLD